MKATTFIVLVLLSFSGNAVAGNNRSFCKKFYPGANLSYCTYQQEAAMNRMISGIYDDFVTRSCLEKGRRVDRVATYTDYIVADECAMIEQRRLDEEEALRASAARDRAAAELYKEKAKAEREDRMKIYFIRNKERASQ